MSSALAALTVAFGLAAAAPAHATQAEPAGRALSPEAAQVADWIAASGDNNGAPFVIIDKRAALVVVYDAAGRMLGAEPALLGLAVGDESVPGIGDRPLSSIRPEERTTPAGRFVAGYGRAKGPDPVLWVDFATAISLHAVVTSNRQERRLERLQSPDPDEKRITYGCINVSTEFYRTVVREVFKDTRGVFYILPDTKPLEEVFPDLNAPRLANTVPELLEAAADSERPTAIRTSYGSDTAG